MNPPSQPRLRLYSLVLQLYPAAFRKRYADEMLETARLEYVKSPHPVRFAAALASDTLRSLVQEHLRAAKAASPGYVAAFALFFSMLLLAVAVITQQYLRRSADSQPTFVAKLVSSPMPDARSETVRAHIVAQILNPQGRWEISSRHFLNRPLTFAILYDASGRALGGNGTLRGALPQPPHGIFNVIQQRGEYKVTWQPQPGIRVALTGRPMPNGGFVLAGQSLLPSEARTARFYSFLRWIWAFAMLACCSLALFARKHTRNLTT
jgi:hypothetical protein